MSKTLTRNSTGIYQIINGEKIIGTSLDLSNPVYIDFEPIPDTMHGFEPLDVALSIKVAFSGVVYSAYGDTWAEARNKAIDKIQTSYEKTIFVKISDGTLIGSIRYTRNSSYTITRELRDTEWTIPRYYIEISGVNNNATVEFQSTTYVRYSAVTQQTMRLERGANNECAVFSLPAPTMTATYNEGSVVTELNSPKGFVDRTSSTVFSWSNTYSTFPVGTVTQTSATLRWKQGASGTVHTINISGSSTSYTMAANTLPSSDDIYWQVSTNTSAGSATSAWQKITTIDTIPVTTAISPNGVYIDGSTSIRFTWSHSTETGTAQKKYDIQTSTDGSTWTTISSETTPNQYADISADTFVSGTLHWRVRTYNVDNVAGDWSNELTCIVISNPSAPGVVIDAAVPFAQIRWTASDQQAYEIKTGTTNTGIIYGTDKKYTFPQPLDDGLTTVSVRVMNIYGLWSPWGSATANIVNTPGTAPTLTADAGEEASLSWTAVSLSSEYWVYRNNTLIARTTELTYIDRTVSGFAVYRVRAIMSDGRNYTDSNIVSVTVTVDHPSVFALDGSAAVDLTYSMSSAPTVTTSLARDISFMQYNNTELPTTEVSPFRSRSVTIAPAFKSASEAAAFESLIGKLVCYRDQYGTNITGVMSAMSKTQTVFFVSYATTITEVDPTDYEIY